MPDIHPADAFGDLAAVAADPAALAELAALLAADREARVGARWQAIVTRHPDGDRVEARPLPDLSEVLDLLGGRILAFDTETTGLHPFLGHRVTSVGIVAGTIGEEGFREEEGAFEARVNPGRPSSPDALAVHGMSDAELAARPPFRAIAREVALRLDDAVAIAHNAPFDVDFLDLEFGFTPYAGISGTARTILDSRVIAKMLWPDEPGSLDALANRLGVDRGGRDRVHGALADARLLARCLPGLAAAIARRLNPMPPAP